MNNACALSWINHYYSPTLHNRSKIILKDVLTSDFCIYNRDKSVYRM